MNAPSMYSEPCAKLTTRVTPKISVRPAATEEQRRRAGEAVQELRRRRRRRTRAKEPWRAVSRYAGLPMSAKYSFRAVSTSETRSLDRNVVVVKGRRAGSAGAACSAAMARSAAVSRVGHRRTQPLARARRRKCRRPPGRGCRWSRAASRNCRSVRPGNVAAGNVMSSMMTGVPARLKRLQDPVDAIPGQAKRSAAARSDLAFANDRKLDFRVALRALVVHDVEEVEEHPVAVVARDVGAASLLPDEDVFGDELVDCAADQCRCSCRSVPRARARREWLRRASIRRASATR